MKGFRAIHAAILVLLVVCLLIYFGGTAIASSMGHDEWWVDLVLGLVCLLVIVVAGFLWLLKRMQAAAQGQRIAASLQAQADNDLANARPDQEGDADELAGRFEEGLQAVKSSRMGKGALYSLPWYVIIGPSGSGKTTLLRHSGLNFLLDHDRGIRGLGGTRNCDWFFTSQAIFLDTAGRYSTEREDRPEWLEFLGLLREARPLKPINGAIVAISLADILELSDAGIHAEADRVRDRLEELAEGLEMVYPAYLVFTKCDLIAGFAEFFASLGDNEREQLFGVTFAADDPRPPDAVLNEELERITEALEMRRVAELATPRPHTAQHQVYTFPAQFRSVRDRIKLFAELLLSGHVYRDTARIRGVFLTSSVQEGAPFEMVLSRLHDAFGIPQDLQQPEPAAPQDDDEKTYFVGSIFRDVVFEDRNTARLSDSARRKAKQRRWITAAAAGLVTALIGVLATSSRSGALDTVKEAEKLLVAEKPEKLDREALNDRMKDLWFFANGLENDEVSPALEDTGYLVANLKPLRARALAMFDREVATVLRGRIDDLISRRVRLRYEQIQRPVDENEARNEFRNKTTNESWSRAEADSRAVELRQQIEKRNEQLQQLDGDLTELRAARLAARMNPRDPASLRELFDKWILTPQFEDDIADKVKFSPWWVEAEGEHGTPIDRVILVLTNVRKRYEPTSDHEFKPEDFKPASADWIGDLSRPSLATESGEPDTPADRAPNDWEQRSIASRQQELDQNRARWSPSSTSSEFASAAMDLRSSAAGPDGTVDPVALGTAMAEDLSSVLGKLPQAYGKWLWYAVEAKSASPREKPVGPLTVDGTYKEFQFAQKFADLGREIEESAAADRATLGRERFVKLTQEIEAATEKARQQTDASLDAHAAEVKLTDSTYLLRIKNDAVQTLERLAVPLHASVEALLVKELETRRQIALRELQSELLDKFPFNASANAEVGLDTFQAWVGQGGRLATLESDLVELSGTGRPDATSKHPLRVRLSEPLTNFFDRIRVIRETMIPEGASAPQLDLSFDYRQLVSHDYGDAFREKLARQLGVGRRWKNLSFESMYFVSVDADGKPVPLRNENDPDASFDWRWGADSSGFSIQFTVNLESSENLLQTEVKAPAMGIVRVENSFASTPWTIFRIMRSAGARVELFDRSGSESKGTTEIQVDSLRAGADGNRVTVRIPIPGTDVETPRTFRFHEVTVRSRLVESSPFADDFFDLGKLPESAVRAR